MTEQKIEEAKEHHQDEDALIPHDVDILHQWNHLLLEDQWRWNGERGKVIGYATSSKRDSKFKWCVNWYPEFSWGRTLIVNCVVIYLLWNSGTSRQRKEPPNSIILFSFFHFIPSSFLSNSIFLLKQHDVGMGRLRRHHHRTRTRTRFRFRFPPQFRFLLRPLQTQGAPLTKTQTNSSFFKPQIVIRDCLFV